MVMETIEQILSELGAADIDTKLEEQLIDGLLFAFQEQQTDDSQVGSQVLSCLCLLISLGDVEWIWCGRELPGITHAAVPCSSLWYHQMASE